MHAHLHLICPACFASFSHFHLMSEVYYARRVYFFHGHEDPLVISNALIHVACPPRVQSSGSLVTVPPVLACRCHRLAQSLSFSSGRSPASFSTLYDVIPMCTSIEP